jgi:hypothetical protein
MKETKKSFFIALSPSLTFFWNFLSCSNAHLWTYPFFVFLLKDGFLDLS